MKAKTLNFNELVTTYPNHLWLEFSQEDLETALPSQYLYSNQVAYWNAYVNRLCLNRFTTFLFEELLAQQPNSSLSAWPKDDVLPSIWEFVNGAAIILGQTKLILIPSEVVEPKKFCVPREWIDIPSWAGDYYLAIQVNIEEDGKNCWMRIWGYTTHRQLKRQNRYEAAEVNYSILREDIIENFTTFWLAQKLRPHRKADFKELPQLSLEQAEQLLDKVGKPSLYSPRLRVGIDISFEKFGCLLANSQWRQELHWRRLNKWLVQDIIPGISRTNLNANESTVNIAQKQGWKLQYSQQQVKIKLGAKGVKEPSNLTRSLVIEGKTYQLNLIPEKQAEDRQQIWCFELLGSEPNQKIPLGYVLRLLTEELESFDFNEDIAHTEVPKLSVRFQLSLGETITWETEPKPEDYEREFIVF